MTPYETVAEWNRLNPHGTVVRYYGRRCPREQLLGEARTMGPAFVRSGMMPSVDIEITVGNSKSMTTYCLDALEVVDPNPRRPRVSLLDIRIRIMPPAVDTPNAVMDEALRTLNATMHKNNLRKLVMDEYFGADGLQGFTVEIETIEEE